MERSLDQCTAYLSDRYVHQNPIHAYIQHSYRGPASYISAGATPQGATSVSVNAPPFAPPFSTYTEHPYTSWTPPPPPPPEQGDKTGAFLSQLREGSDGANAGSRPGSFTLDGAGDGGQFTLWQDAEGRGRASQAEAVAEQGQEGLLSVLASLCMVSVKAWMCLCLCLLDVFVFVFIGCVCVCVYFEC